ncbi:MAG: trehalose-6-phosphate synthase [Dehalococcoidia bacterium]
MSGRTNDRASENASANQKLSGPQSSRRLILVSNRGPVEHRTNERGDIEQVCASGGVAAALSALAPGRPITWIAAATGALDRVLATQGELLPLDDGKYVRLIAPPREVYDLFYGTFSNPVLWFVQHAMYDRLEMDDVDAVAVDAWQRGYLPVNQIFAETVIDELERSGSRGRVMLHDYHLYAAPLFIRNRRPDAVLQHFVHIPWPQPDAWRVLRTPIVQSICEGLLANDSVAFQTQAFARNFIDTCRAYLTDCEATADRITHAGRSTRVWANPVSVDIWDLRRQLALPEAEAYRSKLAAPPEMRTIVRVDRLDPSKNVATGFRAFGRLLESHPEWVGKVRFLSFLVPSRTGVAEYRRYKDEVFAAAGEVNARFATPDWQPVAIYYEHNRLQALVAMSLYDVLLVNPLIDGMNLVSKEGPAVNARNGALVLSETTGAFEELRAGAIPVLPHDIAGTAAALDRALRLPAEERRECTRLLREAIVRHDLRRWFRLLLEDLDAMSEDEPQASGPAREALRTG